MRELDEIRKEQEEMHKKIEQEYGEVLRAYLKETGLDKSVVRKQDSIAGKLEVELDYGVLPAKFVLKFYPYTKAGAVSKKQSGYVPYGTFWNNEENMKSLLDNFRPMVRK